IPPTRPDCIQGRGGWLTGPPLLLVVTVSGLRARRGSSGCPQEPPNGRKPLQETVERPPLPCHRSRAGRVVAPVGDDDRAACVPLGSAAGCRFKPRLAPGQEDRMRALSRRPLCGGTGLSASPPRRHAVVVGGGLAGMLAARILSDHFDAV